MAVWLRELAGWLLLGAGLAAFGLCYSEFLLKKRLLEAVPMTAIGFVVFRGGLHLLKVAIAARACRDAAAAAKPVAPPKRPRVGLGRPDPGPRKSAVPGPGR